MYPFELIDPPVDWDQKFDDINVEFLNELPDLKFFDTAKRDSLLVIDDLWTEACSNPSIIKSFKVFSRKMGISIIIVSQRFFSGGEAGREIRNNWLVNRPDDMILILFFSNVVTIFDNHGNRKMNKRILETLGYEEFSRHILNDFRLNSRHYVVINLSAEIENDLRVCTNLFHEKYENVLFY